MKASMERRDMANGDYMGRKLWKGKESLGWEYLRIHREILPNK